MRSAMSMLYDEVLLTPTLHGLAYFHVIEDSHVIHRSLLPVHHMHA